MKHRVHQKKKALHATARLIVHRVKRLNPASVPEGQSELFSVRRHHDIFTDCSFVLADAEPLHRDPGSGCIRGMLRGCRGEQGDRHALRAVGGAVALGMSRAW